MKLLLINYSTKEVVFECINPTEDEQPAPGSYIVVDDIKYLAWRMTRVYKTDPKEIRMEIYLLDEESYNTLNENGELSKRF